MIQFSYFGLISGQAEGGALVTQTATGVTKQGGAVCIDTVNGRFL
jgi:hypothetical protein